MKATDLFDVSIPAALAAHANEFKAVNATYQFNIAGAGEWNLDLTGNGPKCTKGQGKADCTVSISSADFEKFMQNPKGNAMSMVFTGKLKVTGNKMLGMKLEKVFELVK